MNTKDQPVLVFLHGTAGSPTDFEKQIEYFEDHFRVKSLTLKGHGAAETAHDESYTVQALAEHALKQINAFIPVPHPVVLIGHSLGGLVALELAAQNHDLIKGVILIDTPMLVPEPIAQALAPLSAAFESDAYAATLESFAHSYFFVETDDPPTRKKIMERLLRFPKTIFNHLWNASQSFDAVSRILKSKVPALYIHAGVPIDLEKLKEIYPEHCEVQKTTGRSHYAPIFAAEEVNRMIENFLKLRLRGSRD